MKFNADHFYCIGTSHHFCEDFANSAVSEQQDKAYSIVSDGCSSAKESSIGAMLLTKSAEQHLYPVRPKDRADEMVNLAMQGANVFRRTLGMSVEALRATLLTVSVVDGAFRVTTNGDGVVVARHRKNGLEYMELEFSSGAPFYPIYDLTHADRERYLSEFPGNYTIRLHSNGNVEEVVVQVDRANGAITYAYDYPIDQYDLVGVMSDGAQTFYKENMTGTTKTPIMVPVEEVVNEMFSFKNLQPNFVKRRTQKAFKAFEKLGYKHFDDFSIGVVCSHD